MTDAAELRAPSHQVVNRPVEELRAPETPTEEDYRATMLAALRVARARAKLVVQEIEEIGFDLKEGAISPREALRLCMRARIDALFPREGDGA